MLLPYFPFSGYCDQQSNTDRQGRPSGLKSETFNSKKLLLYTNIMSLFSGARQIGIHTFHSPEWDRKIWGGAHAAPEPPRWVPMLIDVHRTLKYK